MAAQAGLCLAWSETPEDTFCRVVAHIKLKFCFFTKRLCACLMAFLHHKQVVFSSKMLAAAVPTDAEKYKYIDLNLADLTVAEEIIIIIKRCSYVNIFRLESDLNIKLRNPCGLT